MALDTFITLSGLVAAFALAGLIVWCAYHFGDWADHPEERADFGGPNAGGEDTRAPVINLPRGRIRMKLKPYMPQPGGAVPFKTTATPRNARTNAANKLPRKAKHVKPRGMA